MAFRAVPPEKICPRGYGRIGFIPSLDPLEIRHLPPVAAGDPVWFAYPLVYWIPGLTKNV